MGKSRKNGKRRLRERFALRKTLFVVPNLITLASVFCGFNAMRLVARDGATETDFYRAAILLIFAAIFDTLDGRVARLTKTQSAFGLQLDSLADIVSFGVAPALLVYNWVLYRYPIAGLFTAFGFVACGAIRLARFNVLSSSSQGAPKTPSKYIVGLPIPPASGILISLVVANHAVGGALSDPRYTVLLMVVTVVLSFLMVSNVRFRSFKNMRFNTATLSLVAFTIGSSVVVGHVTKPQFVLVWLISFYILIGLFETAIALMSRAAKLLRRERESEPPALPGE